MLAIRAHKKFQQGRHSQIYLLTLKKQDKTKMELPVDMVSISASSCRTTAHAVIIICIIKVCNFRMDSVRTTYTNLHTKIFTLKREKFEKILTLEGQ